MPDIVRKTFEPSISAIESYVLIHFIYRDKLWYIIYINIYCNPRNIAGFKRWWFGGWKKLVEINIDGFTPPPPRQKPWIETFFIKLPIKIGAIFSWFTVCRLYIDIYIEIDRYMFMYINVSLYVYNNHRTHRCICFYLMSWLPWTIIFHM